MPKTKKSLIKKPLKTIIEDSKWKNLVTINKITKKVSKNKDLEKLAYKWNLPWYELVKPNDKENFLRSEKDKIKKNNLDTKIQISKPTKIWIKKVIKSPRKIKK